MISRTSDTIKSSAAATTPMRSALYVMIADWLRLGISTPQGRSDKEPTAVS
jgi:hypothetical protein